MFLQWLTDKIAQRTKTTKHNVIKLRWQKAKLERLLANKEHMTPEEFLQEYKKLTA